jgi:PHD/YefM family antitoxin component YafN of YafNO toxin-antitoxin module
MENTLTISEIKRRGMAAIDDRLKIGPTHIMKRNKQAAVILSEAQYQRLLGRENKPLPGMTALQWLTKSASTGKRRKAAIDADVQKERAW